MAVSLWMDRQVRANKRELSRVGLVLSLGCVLLLIEIALLTVPAAW